MEMYENCARKIQSYWRSSRNRKLFKLLVSSVRSAERCFTPDVLRHLSPREAELLKDPCLKYSLRFRFAGLQFPPFVVFKIFHTGIGGHYLSGKKLFTPPNQATADTCRMMGTRAFMDLITVDEFHRQSGAITEAQDVICMRDYMQYSSHMDELPACLGGRENGWRFLSLKVLSRNILREEIKSEMRSPVVGNVKKRLSWRHLALSQRGLSMSMRCSARAKTTAARKRRLYTPSRPERVLKEEKHLDNNYNTFKQMNTGEKYNIKIVLPSVKTEDYDESSSESEWEKEAEKLCSWSKQLNLDAVDAHEYM